MFRSFCVPSATLDNEFGHSLFGPANGDMENHFFFSFFGNWTTLRTNMATVGDLVVIAAIVGTTCYFFPSCWMWAKVIITSSTVISIECTTIIVIIVVIIDFDPLRLNGKIHASRARSQSFQLGWMWCMHVRQQRRQQHPWQRFECTHHRANHVIGKNVCIRSSTNGI